MRTGSRTQPARPPPVALRVRSVPAAHPRSSLPVNVIAASVLGTLLQLALAWTYPSTVAATIDADHADDVCAPNANPCFVRETVVVVNGSVLDFGARSVVIEGSGAIDVGLGSATLRCGAFTATSVGVVVINAQGSRFGLLVGGNFTLEAASVAIAGRLHAHGDEPGAISIVATGDVLLSDLIDVHSGDPDADGGVAEVHSLAGSINLTGPIVASGGRFSQGGTVDARAAVDLVINGAIDASGGEFDGGELDLRAGRDLVIHAMLNVSAAALDGSGGEIDATAGRDLLIGAGASLQADGSRTADNLAGDGGLLSLAAGRDLTLEAGATVRGNGARPDGTGGSFTFTALRTLGVAGRIEASATGIAGSGGDIELDGCDVLLQAGAALVVSGDGGLNALIAHGSMSLAAGSSLTADRASGTNLLRYRDSNSPPVIAGVVTPTAQTRLDPALAPCPLCGGAGSGDEECDDGVACTVDRCDEDGNCVHPSDDGLCADDNPCTTDRCLVSGCRNTPASGPCDDAISCTTTDTCTAEATCVGVSNCPPGTVCSVAEDRCIDIGSTTTTTLTLCGNLLIEGLEECDDGDRNWRMGEGCRANCSLVGCGDADDSGMLSARDALFMLRAAVGVANCEPCVCDVDDTSGRPTATDALRLLRVAIGLPLEIRCPPCR